MRFTPDNLQPTGLVPLLQSNDDNTIDYSLDDYLQLIDEASRVIRTDKPGYVSEKMAPLVARIGLTLDGFVEMVKGLENNFSYGVGRVEYLEHFVPSIRFKSNPNRLFVEDCYHSLVA